VFSSPTTLDVSFQLIRYAGALIMNSIGAATYLRRRLITNARSKLLSECRPFLVQSRRPLFYRATPQPLGTRREFSVGALRKFANADDSFDPRSAERESDQVDVVIVGGGILSSNDWLTTTNSHRAIRTECRNSIETASKRGR
jgi:hypothetical protein